MPSLYKNCVNRDVNEDLMEMSDVENHSEIDSYLEQGLEQCQAQVFKVYEKLNAKECTIIPLRKTNLRERRSKLVLSTLQTTQLSEVC
mmetsp:Transcript_17239/g.19269  ORF Transcript_17239/g.19269 Transcript_17239/m.19269 type:complete len:88 (-) Transcript_17239:123-386(-)